MIKKNIDDYIKISQNTKNKLNQCLESFFKYVETQYDLGFINPIYYNDLLLVISEAYPLLTQSDKWEEVGYNLCKGLKQDIEKYKQDLS